MCGIVGLINTQLAGEQLTQTAESMSRTLVHRGPDSGGVWKDADTGLALAHRRLAIQDLSQFGHQPMHSSSGRYATVFNGEIYNFKSLAAELAEHGHRFNGHSDTEVVLAAIEQWGIENALLKFVGMFALAIWDRQTKKLFLCRDRSGEKPLYYGWLNNQFVFASELKPIISFFRQHLHLNRDALALFMRHGYVPAPHSIYKGIYKLPPASFIAISSGSVKPADFSPAPATGTANAPKLYWDIVSIAKQSSTQQLSNEQEAIEQLDSLLHDTIKGQSIADVPLGTFLSGGIDSTTVTAILQATTSSPVKTFTIGFEEGDFNEAEFAKKIADHLGTRHTELYVSAEDSLKLIPQMPAIYDEPFADSSQIPTYLISKLAREQVTVCLSGDGGDELFAGYNRYLHTESLARRFSRLPGALKNTMGFLVTQVPPQHWNRMHTVMHTLLPALVGKQSNIGLKMHKAANIMRLSELQDIYQYLMSYWQHPEALVLNSHPPGSLFHDPSVQLNGPFIEQAMLWDQLGYLPGDNLTKVDRASMAVSLETRLPLLDHRVVEFSWRVPLSMKIQRNKSKWLLRQVLYKYVPKELIERPKMGFSVPIGAWLRGPLRDWAEHLLATRRLEQQGILNTRLVRETWLKHLSGSHDSTQALWTVLMFQAWFDTYKPISD